MATKKHWELIAGYLSGEISTEEKKALDQWRKDSPLNEQLFSEAERIWEISGQLQEDFTPDAEKAWNKLKEKIENRNNTPSNGIYFPLWLKIAAAIVLLLGLGYILKMVSTDPAPLSDQLLAKIEIMPADSVQHFHLPDSSRIWLNKNSSLSYSEHFTDTARMVNLNGEAYFEVLPSEKSFVVMAGDNRIRVTGTSFNIRAYKEEEEVELNVVSGEVEFSQKDKSSEAVRIKKDETMIYHKTTGELSKQKNEGRNKWWDTKGKKGIEKIIKQVGKDIKKGIKKIK